jgi:hypothetical protein
MTATTAELTLVDQTPLDLGIEELDEFVAPFDFDDFKEGFAVGAGLGAATGGAVLAAAAIT